MSTPALPDGPSLARRLAAAVALAIGFYVLAIVVAAACFAAAILPWIVIHHGNVWLSGTAAFAGLSVLSTLSAGRQPFKPPGARLMPAEQPRLHALLADEVRAAGAQPPDEVYATLEMNAGVAQIRRRRIMLVGLPLLHLLTERELRAVVAHELAHYAGGDDKLGAWIERTRAGIGRTIVQLTDEEHKWSRRIVRRPFIWYGNAFLRVTNAISRRQELAADVRAARSAGRDAHASALRKLEGEGALYDAYWRAEVAPVLEAGWRPPICEGFRRFLADERIRNAAEERLGHELAEGATSPYDSHPSLPERLAAVEALAPGDPDHTPVASGLIDRIDQLEAAGLYPLTGRSLGPVSWEDVGTAVYLDRARHLVAEFPELVPDVALGALPEAVEAIPRTAEERRGAGHDPDELAAAVVAGALLIALQRGGWTITALPAEPVTACRDDEALIPHAAVEHLRAGTLGADEWRSFAEGCGIAELRLRRGALSVA